VTRRHLPAWWPAACGVLAGVLALVVAIVLTVGGWQPDSFAMGLIVMGILLVGGINLNVAARALAPAERIVRALAEERDP